MTMNRMVLELSHSELYDNTFIINSFLSCLSKAGFSILNHIYHSFHPQGLTHAVLLGESHAVISTWPELGYAEIDIACCSETYIELFNKFCEELVEKSYTINSKRIF